jgi:hypothetical protein
MQLFAEFRSEHQLVDRVAGSLFRFAWAARNGDPSPQDVEDFVHFFRVFVSGYHHEREEQTLFPALIERAEVPADRGPLPAIEADHQVAVALVDELESARNDGRQAAEVARRLEGRAPTENEIAARELGEELTERFPPLDDPEIVRGDGCIACSAFGETCGGIESEWWNDWEHEYHRSLDDG